MFQALDEQFKHRDINLCIGTASCALGYGSRHWYGDLGAEALVDAVMGRVFKLANGDDDFCRYCGKEGVNTRCSKCKKARFCQACVGLGWKYHKVWCFEYSRKLYMYYIPQ